MSKCFRIHTYFLFSSSRCGFCFSVRFSISLFLLIGYFFLKMNMPMLVKGMQTQISASYNPLCLSLISFLLVISLFISLQLNLFQFISSHLNASLLYFSWIYLSILYPEYLYCPYESLILTFCEYLLSSTQTW